MMNMLGIICDNCKSGEFLLAIDNERTGKELLAKGWVVKKVDGRWRDFCCEDCYREFQRVAMKNPTWRAKWDH